MPPKPSLAASNPVDPSPFEMPAIVQSDVRGDLNTPQECLKLREWVARTPQFAFKSASPVENSLSELICHQNRVWSPRTRWTPVPLKCLRYCNQMCVATQKRPGGGLKREHWAHAPPSALSSRPLPLKNLLSELIYHQNRAWSPRAQWTPVPLKSLR